MTVEVMSTMIVSVLSFINTILLCGCHNRDIPKHIDEYSTFRIEPCFP